MTVAATLPFGHQRGEVERRPLGLELFKPARMSGGDGTRLSSEGNASSKELFGCLCFFRNRFNRI